MRNITRRTRAEVYLLWLKKLRSGEYEQGTGRLRNGCRFCPFGVLCDLASKDGGPEWNGFEFMGQPDRLRREVREFMGMTLAATKVLLNMNDIRGHSFNQIAEYIEFKIMPRALEKEPTP